MTRPPDAELDARDLKCPLPVLKARKALKALAPGQVLRVQATDPKSPQDMQAFCDTTGHAMLAMQINLMPYEFLIEKRA